jgi:hypothetical protein
MEAKIQFIKGLDEKVLPDVRLTRQQYYIIYFSVKRFCQIFSGGRKI